MNTLTPKQEEIAVRAYHLFIEGGCQHGRDLEYWFQAERELGGKFFVPPAAEVPVKKTAAKKAPAKKAAKKAPAKKAAGKPNLTTAALMAQPQPADA